MKPECCPRRVGCLVVGLSLGLAGCQNIFENLSTKNTNDAYYADAQTAMNQRDYTRALTKLLATTPAYQARRDVTLAIASAYAGRCGLDFLGLTQAVINAPTQRLFPLLVSNFRGSSTGHIADCAAAQSWALKLAPGNDFTQMSADESLFLAVVSIAKIGVTLATYADLNQDGTADPSFDACNTTMLSDASRRDVGVSVNLILAGLSAAGNTKLAGATAGVSAVCASLPPAQNFCGVFDPVGFSSAMDQALGGLIGSQDMVGLGTCAHDFATCVCH